jgi:hypothetical protein
MVMVHNPHEKRGVTVSVWCVGMQSTVFVLFILRELYNLSLAILFCWVLPSICVLSLFFFFFLSLSFFLYWLCFYLVDCNTSCFVFIVITCLTFGRSCIKFPFICKLYAHSYTGRRRQRQYSAPLTNWNSDFVVLIRYDSRFSSDSPRILYTTLFY